MSFKKNIKFISVGMLIYGLALLGVVLFTFKYIYLPIESKDLAEEWLVTMIANLFWVIFLIIGGTGLFFQKKWSVYFVSVPGILMFTIFLLGLVLFLITLLIGVEAQGPEFIQAQIFILGIISIYLLKNRNQL